MSDRCRTCKAEVIWATTESGRLMPVDPEPAADGTLRLVPVNAGDGVPRVVVVPAEQRDGELYRSHFATCPFADQHRRPR